MPRVSVIVCKSFLLLLSAMALVWSGTMLASGRLSTDLDAVAQKILRGESFRSDNLDALEPRIIGVEADPFARPASLRSAAIITLHRAEVAIAEGRRIAIDERLDQLGRLLGRALQTSPTDSYLWLALFWYRNNAHGYDPANVALLARSYDLGPAEGWIGVRRVRLALPILSHLPAPLQERVVKEFAFLVNAQFPEMPGVLVGAGWAEREKLLARLATVKDESRRTFARSLGAMGYILDVPNLAPVEDRPWTR